MTLKTFILIIFLAIILFWLIVIEKVSKTEDNKLQEKEVKGTIQRMFKKETNKNYTIVFSNGSDFELPYSAPNDRIEPGDSMFKAANSLYYIFFKGGNILDTILFQGILDGKVRP